MKHLARKIAALAAICCLTLFMACQEDDSHQHHDHEHGTTKVVWKSFDEFPGLQNLVDATTRRTTANRSEGGFDPYDFTIHRETVMQATNGRGDTYYTVAITRDGEQPAVDMFENLVIHENDSIQEAHIVTYFPNFQYYRNLQTNIHAPYVGGMTVDELGNNYQNRNGLPAQDCKEWTITYCNQGGEVHLATDKCTKVIGSYTFIFCKPRSPIGAPTDREPLRFVDLSAGLGGSGGGGGGGAGYSGPPNPTAPNEPAPEDPNDPQVPGLTDPSGGGVITQPIMPLKAVEKMFVGGLSKEQKDFLKTEKGAEVKAKVLLFLDEEGDSPENMQLAEEMVELSMDFEVNAAEIWLTQDDYRSHMSAAERQIFDAQLPNRRVNYLVAAQRASDLAKQHFPNTPTNPSSLHNGKGDAFRHALWNGLSSILIGADLTEQLTTAHEDSDIQNYYLYTHKEIQMDLYNNQQGRNVAAYSNRSNITPNILQHHQSGGLKYLNNLDNSGFATSQSSLIFTNQ